ncbi:MAG: bifunctional UDP-sugar hydrolase/5'-nucleotidase [Rhizobiaceae bacterium]
MKTTLIKTLLTASLAAGISFTALSSALAEKVNVTFLVASDMYKMSGKKRGGAARLAAVIKAERAKGGNSIYVFPGDLLSPSILSGFDKGAHMIDLLNMAPPDFLVPGNHEFDFGPENFLVRMKQANFPKLATNIRDKDGKEIDGFISTKILTYGDLKIGLMGLTLESTPDLSSSGDIKFLNTMETAQATNKKLREQGADTVVAVVHTSRAMDYNLLYKSGVDIVLSGHDHNLNVFYDGKRSLVESMDEAKYVVAMDVEFDIGESRGKRKVRWWPNYRIIDTSTVTPDPEVAAKIAIYESALSKELDVAIGKLEVELDTRKSSVRSKETAFGNLVADGMRLAVGADIGFTNGGGIRGNTVYDAGHTITRKDVLTELPFGNVTVKMEVTGAIILEALEHAYRKLPDTNGGFLHVSNLKVAIDSTKPSGSRISDVMVGGEALDPAKTYTLATNDFMGRGGDGYRMLRKGKMLINKSSAKLMANDVMVHIRKLGAVKTTIDGRLMIK